MLCALAVVAREGVVTPESRTPVFASLPLYFEANHGQAGGEVQFLARGQACQFMVASTRAILTLSKMTGHTARGRHGLSHPMESRAVPYRSVFLEFLGANPDAQVTGEGGLPGKINYLLGNDPARWHAGVSTFTRVRVTGIYPGVDLVYYGNQRRLEYDFVVSPNADPGVIAVRFDGPEEIRVDGRGDLLLRVGAEEIRQPKPVLYQDIGGVRREIAGTYRFTDTRTVAFQIGEYDRSQPLVIDPVLSYSTYFGGSVSDVARAVAVDDAGFVYVAGETMSAALPATPGAFGTNYAGGTSAAGDAFIAKFDNSATSLVYLTYLGGRTSDGALALKVDAAGNAYVTGYTDSTNFPVVSALYTNLSGSPYPSVNLYPLDAFVAKLDASGSQLVYSTYLGGEALDEGIGIALDAAGNAYVAGYTESTNFPTRHATYTNYGGNGDGFIARLDAAGTNLVYSMFLGGTNQDVANDIATDAAGFAYLTGYTVSTNFPITNAVQSHLNNRTNATTAFDAFLTKLTPAGEALVFSTFLGGESHDVAYRLALDANAGVYMTGQTRSEDFPRSSTNLFSPVANGSSSSDVFVTKFDTNGQRIYSVMFGGRDADEGWDVAVDGHGQAYIVGLTASPDFPTRGTSGFLRDQNAGGTDAFVAQLDANAQQLRFSAYLGGRGTDFARGLDLDAAGNAYVVGETASANFPTNAPFQAIFGGVKDTFLAKLTAEPTLTVTEADGEVQVAWRAFAPDFVLQATTNIIAPVVWNNVPQTPVLTNGWHTVTLGATNGPWFFRLHRP